MPGWWRETARGVALQVRLTPKGGADRIDGIRASADGGVALAARVRAAPEKGAANAALEALVAGALGVAKGQVAVTSGHKSRLKTVEIARQLSELRGALDAISKEHREKGGEGS